VFEAILYVNNCLSSKDKNLKVMEAILSSVLVPKDSLN
jgi:hypothetical protein